jgi:hypothetical protein
VTALETLATSVVAVAIFETGLDVLLESVE